MDGFRWTLTLEVVFVVASMAYIGLSVTWSQVLSLLRDWNMLGRTLLANLVFAPLLAFALIEIFPMPRDAQVALLLISVAPGGLNVLQFTTKIGGRLAQAAALLFMLSLISLVTTPLGAALLPMPREPEQMTALRNIMAFLAAVLLPMFLGSAVS